MCCQPRTSGAIDGKVFTAVVTTYWNRYFNTVEAPWEASVTLFGGRVWHRFSVCFAVAVVCVSQFFVFSAGDAVAEERGFLGMQVQGMSPKIAEALSLEQGIGVLVRDISIDGPAAHAGITRGDLIVKMKGIDIDTFDRLLKVAGTLAPGEKVAIELRRLGKSMTVEMTIAEWPIGWKVEDSAFAAQPEIGVTFAALTPQLRDRLGIRWGATGIVVTIVNDAFSTISPLRRGDIVTQINQTQVWEPSQFLDAYGKAKQDGRSVLLLLVERSDGFKYLLQPVGGAGPVAPPDFKLPGQAN